MDQFDRIYTLYKILRAARRPVPRRVLEQRLECSRATVNRTLSELRDYMGAPIEYDRQFNGYRYTADGDDPPYELPGLWFNASELHALLVTDQLLSQVQPGLLGPYITPLRRRIDAILRDRRLGGGEITKRIRVLPVQAREARVEHFTTLARALIERKRLHIFYHGRGRDETTDRTVSPQRLVYYKSNWYLDAWCHLRRALRSFAVDRLHVAEIVDQPAREIAEDRLDGHYAAAYGIFAGKARHTAVLRFNAQAARWVADEQWHPGQQLRILPDGGCELRVPYADPRELLMDILRYGPDVEVLSPANLRKAVAARLRRAAACYDDIRR